MSWTNALRMLLAIAGAGMLIFGTAQLSQPAAYLVAGGLLIAATIGTTAPPPPPPEGPPDA